MTRCVGIILVSHSRDLADGLRALLLQVASGTQPIEAAGGTEDGRLGTSYTLVASALKRADQGAGVVMLPDLGSSVLTARAVLADHADVNAVLVDAPIVEGAVAAAVTAAAGADLATVVAAAQEARHVPKF